MRGRVLSIPGAANRPSLCCRSGNYGVSTPAFQDYDCNCAWLCQAGRRPAASTGRVELRYADPGGGDLRGFRVAAFLFLMAAGSSAYRSALSTALLM